MLVPVAILAVGVWTFVMASVRLRRPVAAIVYISVALMPMIGVRLTPELTAADGMVVAGLTLLGLQRLREGDPFRVGPHRRLIQVVGLLTAGGVIGMLGSPAATGAELGRLTFAVLAVLVLVAWWRPDRGQVRAAAFFFSVGAATSGVVGMATGASSLGGRLYGLSTHANHLAIANVLGTIVSFGIALSSDCPRTMRTVAKGLVPLHLLIVLETGSRAGLLGVFVGMVALVAATRSRRILLIGVAGGVAAVMLLGVGAVNVSQSNAIRRVAGDDSSAQSDVERLQLLDMTLDQIRANPVTGDGFQASRVSHSVPLQYWRSAGVLGLAAFIILVAITGRGARQSGGDLLAAGLWCAFVGYLAASFVSNQMWDRYIWVVAALAVALSTSSQSATAVEFVPRRAGATEPPWV